MNNKNFVIKVEQKENIFEFSNSKYEIYHKSENLEKGFSEFKSAKQNRGKKSDWKEKINKKSNPLTRSCFFVATVKELFNLENCFATIRYSFYCLFN